MGSSRDVVPRRLIALGCLIGAAVIIVVGLNLASRGAASSTSKSPSELPIPSLRADRACQNFADFWLVASQLGIPETAVEGIGTCRRAADGTWMLPVGPTDRRLAGDRVMNATERADTAALRQLLLQQMDALESGLSESLSKDVNRLYEPRNRAVSGHLREGVQIGRTRTRYKTYAEAWLVAPENAQLAGYVGWWMERRMDAYAAFNETCSSASDPQYLAFACDRMEDALSVRYPPWPWDLRDPLTLEEYLRDVARNPTALPSSDAS